MRTRVPIITMEKDVMDTPVLRCYYCHDVRSVSSNTLLVHYANQHPEAALRIRRLILEEHSGVLVWKSIHFPLNVCDIKSKIQDGMKCILDTQNAVIRFKRPSGEDVNTFTCTPAISETHSVLNDINDEDKNILEVTKQAMHVIQETGRGKDFMSLLSAIGNGSLDPHNIGLHLLLDIGNFLAAETLSQVSYKSVTLDFWSVVYKMFKGKSTRFFRGTMSAELDQTGPVKTKDCKFNFVVPSERTLAKHTMKQQVGGSVPGVLQHSLEAFANEYRGSDCKLSFDGKKLSYGFGKNLGEEDLCGHEESPTLEERKKRYQIENELISSLEEKCLNWSIDNVSITELPSSDVCDIKEKIMKSITVLSNRIRELRLVVSAKKRSLHFLQTKIQGDWKTSSLAPSVSFLKTKIIQATSCIRALLSCIDDYGNIMAHLNGVSHLYVHGSHMSLDLSTQCNYMCLRHLSNDATNSLDPMKNSKMIKQHSEQWHDVRKNACTTGSTWFAALGLSTLKEQKLHHSKVFEGTELIISPELQELFDYGNRNEINGLATLLGKYLPVFHPDLIYKEDGCNIIQLKAGVDTTSYAVSSGDGAGFHDDGTPKLAFEIKCPKPGKLYETDVCYKLPLRYTIQVLAEMASTDCGNYTNICYSPESTTFISGTSDKATWADVLNLTDELYDCTPRKPTKLHPGSKLLKEQLQQFADNSIFEAEFPSLEGRACHCTGNQDLDMSQTHNAHDSSRRETRTPQMEDLVAICQIAHERHLEAYNLLRRPAKEVLVGVISDLERSHTNSEKQHAVPISYHMSGFSLKMKSVRSIINEVIESCKTKGLSIKVISFDGQFLEICNKNDEGYPTTVYALQKKVWQQARTKSKKELLDFLLSQNNLAPVSSVNDLYDNYTVDQQTDCTVIQHKAPLKTMYTQKDIVKYFQPQKRTKISKGEQVDVDHSSLILEHLPGHLVESLDEDALQLIRTAATKIAESTDLEEEVTENQVAEQTDKTTSIGHVLHTLQNGKTSHKFQKCGIDDIKRMLKNGQEIYQSFTVPELKLIIATAKMCHKVSGLRKPQLVLLVSEYFGDGTEPQRVTRRSPPSLKVLVTRYVSSWPVMPLAIVYCNNKFMFELEQWNVASEFQHGYTVNVQQGNTYVIHQWYAQPSAIQSEPVQVILDPHHILVNNRGRVCAHGLPSLNISKDAWIDVASKSKENGTNLSLELVTEVRDRQRNSYAQTTFSMPVESEMRKYGYTNAANWCQLIRGWYAAVDEAGLSPEERINNLMAIRTFLLQRYSPMAFPPPGAFINSLPVAQFEGLLTNIDRRIQLYAIAERGTYNHRSLSSLDSETFFSCFQDIDPKGSGVLRPDDVPSALSAACFISQQRLRADRPFYMTTARSCVYKHERFSTESDIGRTSQSCEMEDSKTIHIKTHAFDMKTSTTKRKRKCGAITRMCDVGRGATGVREHHKVNEEKILTHRRLGLTDDAVDEV